MAVYHVLKDGSRPKDITGHVVRLEDHSLLCRIVENISQRLNTYEKDHGGKSNESL